MHSQYFLGIDIGTTSVKAVAFSITGEVLFSFSEHYAMYHPAANQSEQKPGEVYEAVVKSCNSIVGSMKGGAPAFVAMSAAMHSIIAIDNWGQCITDCIIWADNRAAGIAEALHKQNKAASFYKLTGVPVHAMTPLCKLMWLQQNEPLIYMQASRFIGIKEFVCQKFTGQYLVDSSIASATGLLNIYSLQWDQSILQQLHLEADKLSQVVAPGFISHFNQAENGNPHALQFLIPNGTPLVMGGSDGAMANLGAGTANGKTMVVTIGTSSAARMVVNKVELDKDMRTFCYHVNNGLYIIGGPGNNGAIVLEWLKDKLLQTPDTIESLLSNVEKIDPGSDDLLFLPYILGERAPLWNSNARGVFFGLDINHTQPHLVRACMEGVLFGVYSIAKILLENRNVQGISATGGFAQSHLWLQMLADICDAEIAVSVAAETSALGAVMVGVEALGYQPFELPAFVAAYRPRADASAKYSRHFHRFTGLYLALKHLWTEPLNKTENAGLVT